MASAPSIPSRTLAAPAAFAGFSLFTGKDASITIKPASPGEGIVFRRVDLPNSAAIPALASHIVPESRRTVLSARPGDPLAPTVQTIEHLMSALAGLGITDALVEVSGPEIPIGDGSAQPFVQAITAAGIRQSPAGGSVAPIVVREHFVIADGPARIEAWPARSNLTFGLELGYQLEYPPGAPIPSQNIRFVLSHVVPSTDYQSAIAPARTFCLAQEAEMMRKAGMFQHLSPRDMLVIGPDGPIDNAYRFPNEPARHKLLDLIGDLALAGGGGRPVIGRIEATRTGHAHNHAMARALAAL